MVEIVWPGKKSSSKAPRSQLALVAFLSLDTKLENKGLILQRETGKQH